MRGSDFLLDLHERAARARVVDLFQRSALVANLRWLHTTAVATVPILGMASQLCTYHPRLKEYYRDHAEEEVGHLTWLLGDLEALGSGPPEEPDANAVAMVGSQYYLLMHRHPVCLLGYLALMEGAPTPAQHVAELEAHHGPLRFVREHAESDLVHRAELVQMLDLVPDELAGDVALSADNALAWMARSIATWPTTAS